MIINKQMPNQILECWQEWGQQLSSKPSLIMPDVTQNASMHMPRALHGLTNKSYLLDSSLGRLVLRINNPASENLGINRHREALILGQVAKLGVGPEIIYQDPSYGYLVYRFIEGRVWTKADAAKPDNQNRLKRIIAQYQQIQLPLEPRNYKNYLLHYWQQLEQQGLIDDELRHQWSAFLPPLDQSDWTACLSHHDLTPENIIETSEGLRVIDWEYAHLGHPDLDWVSISGEQSTPGSSTASNLLFWMNRLWHLLA